MWIWHNLPEYHCADDTISNLVHVEMGLKEQVHQEWAQLRGLPLFCTYKKLVPRLFAIEPYTHRIFPQDRQPAHPFGALLLPSPEKCYDFPPNALFGAISKSTTAVPLSTNWYFPSFSSRPRTCNYRAGSCRPDYCILLPHVRNSWDHQPWVDSILVVCCVQDLLHGNPGAKG